jgi:hypothetical protein
MILDPVTEKWFSQFRVLAPDSRLVTPATEYDPTLGEVEPVFCCSCSRRQGSVTRDRDLFQYFMCLCDDCFEKFGGLPLPEILEPMRHGVFFP